MKTRTAAKRDMKIMIPVEIVDDLNDANHAIDNLCVLIEKTGDDARELDVVRRYLEPVHAKLKSVEDRLDAIREEAFPCRPGPFHFKKCPAS